MRSLLFVLCMALSCVIRVELLTHVSGYEKADVNVSCPYTTGYESHEKYLCRNNCGEGRVLVKTTEKKKKKYSVYDDKKNRVFTATISDLTSMDAGKYWCGVTRLGFDHYPVEVNLQVVPDSCCDQSTTFQSDETGHASISCGYDSEYKNNLKYICRGAKLSTCLQQALITSSSRRDTGQFTLTDDKASGKFTVAITGLTPKDSGLYLCGVHRNTYLDVFSAVELEVRVLQTTTVPSAITGETVVSQSVTRTAGKVLDASLHLLVLSIVTTVLLPLLLISALIMVYKYKQGRARRDVVSRRRNPVDTAHAEEVMDEIHENQPCSVGSMQKTFKQQSACQRYDVTVKTRREPVYQNVSAAENIYCNEI